MFSWKSLPYQTERQKATWGSKARRVAVALVIALICAPSVEAAPKKSGPPLTVAEKKLDRRLRERTSKTGESKVIVELNDNADDTTLLLGYGQKGRKLQSFSGRVLTIPNRLMKQLANHPRVKRIVEDREVQGFNGRTAITIGSRTVVDLMGYNGAGVGVAVVDSGINAAHQDLTGGGTNLLSGLVGGQRVAHFKDFVNNAPLAYDDWGHGTHVAGIVAGNGSASYGRHEGIAPGASIVALKALDGNGVGTISNIIAAIDYAIAVKATYNIRVLNLSLGAGVFESYQTDPLTLAAKRAVDAGIVVVAAAGNLGKAADGSPQYGAITAPGNAPWVLTVGASSTMGTLNREDDTIAGYSSRGPTMHDYLAKPDLVAPGTGTVSLSDPLSLFYTTKPQALQPGLVPGLSYLPYLSLSGTSMAAPAVAGTVALMLHANPNLTPNMVKAILQYTAQVYPGYDYLTQGAGFLNARGAVTLAEYFRTAQPGDAYPRTYGWSKHIFWGNYRVTGGIITPDGSAWGSNIVWGEAATPTGQNIVWGEACNPEEDPTCNIVWGDQCNPEEDPTCNIVWGNNIVWGEQCNPEEDPTCNIVWGNNIVWGETCQGADCDNIAWGESCDENNSNDLSCQDNIVWGESCDENEPDDNTDCQDNIVWGESDDDNIVWGEECIPEEDPTCNIVWGNNIVWGESDDLTGGTGGANDTTIDTTIIDQTSPIDTYDTSAWDALFELSVDILNGIITTVPPPPPLDDNQTVTMESLEAL